MRINTNLISIQKQLLTTLFFIFPTCVFLVAGYLKLSLFEQYHYIYILILIVMFILSFIKNDIIKIFLICTWFFLILQPIYSYYQTNFTTKKFPPNFSAQVVTNNIYGLDSKIDITYDKFGWRNTGHKIQNLRDLEKSKLIVFQGGSTFEQSFIEDKKTSSGLLQSYLYKTKKKIHVINTGVSGFRIFKGILGMKDLNNLIPNDTNIIYVHMWGANDWNWALRSILAKPNRLSNPLITGNGLTFIDTLNPQKFLLTDIARSIRSLFYKSINSKLVYDFDLQHNEVFNTYENKEKFILKEFQKDRIIRWYEEVVQKQINTCQERAGIKCIFLDQPTAYYEGNFNDKSFLNKLWFTPSYSSSALTPEGLIDYSKMFNERLKKIINTSNCKECYFIDASQKLKNPKLFYDDVHFNNHGAKEVYNILKSFLIDKKFI